MRISMNISFVLISLFYWQAAFVILRSEAVGVRQRISPEEEKDEGHILPTSDAHSRRHDGDEEVCAHALLMLDRRGVCLPAQSCSGGISLRAGEGICEEARAKHLREEIVCCAHTYDLKVDVPADPVDSTKSKKGPQIGGMIGVEIEIRYVRVVEFHDQEKSPTRKRYRHPQCVLNANAMWRFDGGIVAADQVLPSPFNPNELKTEGCAEYVTDPIPVSKFVTGMRRVGRGIKADMEKLSTMRKPISSTMDAVSGCSDATVKAFAKLLPPPGLPAPQLTFSTCLAGLGSLNIGRVFHSSKARDSWETCAKWCRDRSTEFCGSCGPHNVNAFEGFCTLACHYGASHKTSGHLQKPGCKETPKILVKHSLPDMFLGLSENEPVAFSSLQDMFDSYADRTRRRRDDDDVSSMNSFDTYIECLSRKNFGETQMSGNGAQYRGSSSKCIDWDYHGQCYASNPEQYPSIEPGTMTHRVLQRGEIYPRRGFCASDDVGDDGICTKIQSLVIVEVRESASPVVQGLHDGATSTPTFLDNLAQGRTGSAFKEFLNTLRSLG